MNYLTISVLGKIKPSFFLLIFLFSLTSFAQEVPEIPSSPRLVNDFYGILDHNQVASLENKLLKYNDTTSTEVVIVTEASSHGRETMEYATDLFSKWKIGKEGKDNGLLIYLAIEDRKMAIVTGYGLEGAIPDAATYTIRERILKPHFRNGQFYEGLDKATTAVFLLAAGEYTADELNNALESQKEPLIGFVVGIAIIILIIIVSMSFRNRGPKAIGRPLSPWEMLILGSGMNRPSSGWTDFSHGSGSFGGGGGFGGFGGGMTGGGGSAGSW